MSMPSKVSPMSSVVIKLGGSFVGCAQDVLMPKLRRLAEELKTLQEGGIQPVVVIGGSLEYLATSGSASRSEEAKALLERKESGDWPPGEDEKDRYALWSLGLLGDPKGELSKCLEEADLIPGWPQLHIAGTRDPAVLIGAHLRSLVSHPGLPMVLLVDSYNLGFAKDSPVGDTTRLAVTVAHQMGSEQLICLTDRPGVTIDTADGVRFCDEMSLSSAGEAFPPEWGWSHLFARRMRWLSYSAWTNTEVRVVNGNSAGCLVGDEGLQTRLVPGLHNDVTVRPS